MSNSFAPGDPRVPQPLRHRIESWATNVPKTQFQQYGPINNFVCGFLDLNRFMVKPQALIREIWTDGEVEDMEIARGIVQNDILDQNAEIGDEGIQELRRRLSIDSNDAMVKTETDQRKYPDFVITTYGINQPDRIKMVIEVGSVGRSGKKTGSESDKENVALQLSRYMSLINQNSGSRCEGILTGVAMIGTEVSIVQLLPPDSDELPAMSNANDDWISIYSPRFLEIFDM